VKPSKSVSASPSESEAIAEEQTQTPSETSSVSAPGEAANIGKTAQSALEDSLVETASKKAESDPKEILKIGKPDSVTALGTEPTKERNAGNNGESQKRHASVPTDGLAKNRIVNGFEAKVNIGQQEKHIPGTNNYKNEIKNGKPKSPMNGNVDEIQVLLNKKAGTGEMIGTNKERVEFGEVIGQYVDITTGTATNTEIGIIHYGKKGAHIVPARPR